MPTVEEEFSKLDEEITRFLAEEGGVDSGDEDIETSTAPRARPGSITPLGVRVDRGAGLLGANGVNAAIGEMDSVLSNIRAWKQKHEREMLELRQRNEQALAQVAKAATTQLQREPEEPHSNPQHTAAPSSASSTAAFASGSSEDPAPVALTPTGMLLAEVGQEHQQQRQQAVDAVSAPPLQLGEEEDEDLVALLRERQERRDRILSGSAAARLRLAASSLAQTQPDGEVLRAVTDAEPQSGKAAKAGSGSGSSRPLSALGQPPLESVLRASLAGPAPPQHLLGPVPVERPTTAVRRKAEEDARTVLLRGQEMLAELEAELRELGSSSGVGVVDLRNSGSDNGGRRGGGDGSGRFWTGTSGTAAQVSFWESVRPRSSGARGGLGNGVLAGSGGSDDDGHELAGVSGGTSGSAHVESLMDWSTQLQGVLAKMDVLQTGYQAAVVTAAGCRPVSGGTGAAAAGSRPDSGGTSTAASVARLGDPSLALRPGSARLRLEPLSQAPGLPAGGAPGQGRAPGLATVSVVTRQGTGATKAVMGPEGPQGHGAGVTVGGDDARGASAQQGIGSGSRNTSDEGDAEAPPGAGAVACAGHRIRQLRELQRHGAGGVSVTGATGALKGVSARDAGEGGQGVEGVV